MRTADEQAGASGRPRRDSVDLSAYPGLVVVYLGFRVGRLRGLRALLGIGRGLAQVQRAMPDGLLAHESLVYGLNHIGMRQYWRDLESLEAFTRSDPHKTWWREFGRLGCVYGPDWWKRYSPPVIAAIIFVLVSRNRRGAISNLRRVLGPQGWWRDRREALRMFVQFAHCFTETHEAYGARPAPVELIPPEEDHLGAALAEGRGAVGLLDQWHLRHCRRQVCYR